MTNKEAIKALTSVYKPENDLLTIALLNQGIDPETDYTGGSSLDGVELFVLERIWAIQSESAGGYSITYNKEALIARVSQLGTSTGRDVSAITGATPTLTDASNCW